MLTTTDPAVRLWNTYALDGKCHNAQDGENECGAPAVWLGERDTDGGPWRCGFCDHCRREGREAKHMIRWTALPAVERGSGANPAPAVKPLPQSVARSMAVQWRTATLDRV